MIQVLKNNSLHDVVMRGGKLLCSFQGPHREAEKWVRQFDLKNQNDVIVIGLGSGYHIRYLSIMYPNLNIHVFETNSEIIEYHEESFLKKRKIKFYLIPTQSQMDSVYRLLEDKTPSILCFRPSWQADYNCFEEFFSRISMREANFLAYYLGTKVSEESVSENQKTYLTLKNLVLSAGVLDGLDKSVLDVFGDWIA